MKEAIEIAIKKVLKGLQNEISLLEVCTVPSLIELHITCIKELSITLKELKEIYNYYD